ncbi:MAG: D-alanine--D-alanine ligase family protein [Solirubrobacteraceae bacterium]
MPLRVLHLVGSAVSDFLCDLSRLYARDCLRTTQNSDRFEPHIAYVTPDRRWRFPADLTREAIAGAPALSAAEGIRVTSSLGIDVMVPQMFCLPGMTQYRALFDLLGIRYVGNPPDVMALGSHKARAKAIVAAAGVDVPAGEVVRAGELPAIEPPVVVKPVDADNSLGVTLVRDRKALADAIATACEHSDTALVETYVELGREVRSGIIVRSGELVCLPLEEYRVDPIGNPIRHAADKLRRDGDGDGELALVAKQRALAWMADPNDPITGLVWEAARRCHRALGCRDYSLFDFRIDPGGRPWFLEAGLYCSFSRQSVISMMAATAGIATDELFAIALDETLAASSVLRPARSAA